MTRLYAEYVENEGWYAIRVFDNGRKRFYTDVHSTKKKALLAHRQLTSAEKRIEQEIERGRSHG
jgi:Holliday junction resolvase